MSYYRQNAIVNIDRAVASASAAAAIRHQGLKGRFREIVIGDLIRPFLLPHIKIATGTVVDPTGAQSSQIDIILYDEQVTPPVLVAPGEAVVPCHSVLATIEVKSRLNATELKGAIRNACSVKRLSYNYEKVLVPPERLYERTFQEKLIDLMPEANFRKQLREHLSAINSPACFIFAFESDLSSRSTIEDEIERLKAAVAETPSGVSLPISGLCIADKGFAFCTRLSGMPPQAQFQSERPDFAAQPRPRGHRYWASHNVTLKFESVLMNTCARYSEQRSRIPLDLYLWS
jgi:hypothetical protein